MQAFGILMRTIASQLRVHAAMCLAHSLLDLARSTYSARVLEAFRLKP